ncbi:MAG: hypothetical protein M0006_09890 [Magnetospirillum sp.]|nr:hypothetical protein [Magnetospirillum sp.]
MSNVDILIYVHPELPADDRARLENTVRTRAGVLGASFDHHAHPHALMVKYDSDATSGTEILLVVRQTDPVATMVGL